MPTAPKVQDNLLSNRKTPKHLNVTWNLKVSNLFRTSVIFALHSKREVAAVHQDLDLAFEKVPECCGDCLSGSQFGACPGNPLCTMLEWKNASAKSGTRMVCKTATITSCGTTPDSFCT